jgi:hypothetical protein
VRPRERGDADFDRRRFGRDTAVRALTRRGSPTHAAFTHTMDGRPPTICFHVFPSSFDPNTWPLRVPK